jgi:hypothetical protein
MISRHAETAQRVGTRKWWDFAHALSVRYIAKAALATAKNAVHQSENVIPSFSQTMTKTLQLKNFGSGYNRSKNGGKPNETDHV